MTPPTLSPMMTEDRPKLTARQAEVLDVIEAAIRQQGYPPTIREIGAKLGIRSPQGVSDHLSALERKGYLNRSQARSRSCVPVLMSDETIDIPLFDGRVAAGQPALAVESRRQTLTISRTLVGRARDVFALEVQGDSMIGDGIYDGDIVFVEKAQSTRPDEITVVRVDDSVTIKRIAQEGDVIRLLSSNPTHADIVIHANEGRSVETVGRLVGVYRALDI